MSAWRKRLTILGFVIVFVAYFAVPAVAANTTLEVESFVVSGGAGAGAPYSDPSASGGTALALKLNSVASKQLSLPAASSVVVRAKGQQCFGAPTMSVSIDGQVKSATSVSATSWTNYTTAATFAAGSHQFSIAYSNDTRNFLCDRNLYIDSVTVVPGDIGTTTPATTTPSTTTPTTTTPTTTTPTTTTPTTTTPTTTTPTTTTPTTTTPTTTTPTPSSSQPMGVPGNWRLTSSDEFNGTAIDLNPWSNCWFSPSCGKMNNVSTVPSNVSVVNGNLVLTLASSSSGALVSTNPAGGAKVGFSYGVGVVESRIFFPGDGTRCYNWPALWTTGQSWPGTGENDIAEVLGERMTVNYHSSSGAHNQGAIPGNWCGAYHVYSINRQATRSDVYYDGVLVKSYATDDNSAPQYVVINVGSGGTKAVYGAASQVKVDYVRVWQ